jgi:cellulose biosynthesis protein BcsQ
VNGDLLSMLDARDRVEHGAYDVLDDPELLDRALRSTIMPNLHILPACGRALPPAALDRADQSQVWSDLVERLRVQADIVLVDCPAGMLHTTHEVVSASTHVLGVFQSEMVASRSFPMFLQTLDTLAPERRPDLVGVVVNMFQRRANGSLEAFERICVDGERHRLLDVTIPRSDAFSNASLAGLPLRLAGDKGPCAMAWLFDALAAEICGRMQLSLDSPPRPQTSFLV